MSVSYIPVKDSAFAVWAANFAAVLTLSYAAYGLTAADALAVSAANTAFQSEYVLATTAATRTKVTIANKDLKRNQLTALCRQYAQVVQSNAGITQDQKTALGLTVRDTKPSPIPAPATSPILTVLGATPSQLTVRYADQNTPTKRAKPNGVIGIQFAYATSATVVSDPNVLPLEIMITKNPVGLDFAASDNGKTAYIAARWITRRGLTGPWSNIVTFTVAA